MSAADRGNGTGKHSIPVEEANAVRGEAHPAPDGKPEADVVHVLARKVTDRKVIALAVAGLVGIGFGASRFLVRTEKPLTDELADHDKRLGILEQMFTTLKDDDDRLEKQEREDTAATNKAIGDLKDALIVHPILPP